MSCLTVSQMQPSKLAMEKATVWLRDTATRACAASNAAVAYHDNALFPAESEEVLTYAAGQLQKNCENGRSSVRSPLDTAGPGLLSLRTLRLRNMIRDSFWRDRPWLIGAVDVLRLWQK